MNKLLAEFFGTFWLVFAGCGSAVFGRVFRMRQNNSLASVCSAYRLAFRFDRIDHGVCRWAYLPSGHFNPAVTLGLVAVAVFRQKDAAGYIACGIVNGRRGVIFHRFGQTGAGFRAVCVHSYADLSPG